MSTPGMQWAQLMGNMLNQGNDQTLQGMRVGQGQQQLDIEKKQQQIQQRQADMEFHQHMTDLGAKPVYKGMVKDQIQTPAMSDSGVPGQPGLQTRAPASSFTVVRKVDPARYVKIDGDSGYELPTHPEQIQNQVNALAPARAAQVQQDQDTAQATATGTAAGQTQGRIADRIARGTPVSSDEATMFHLPAGTLLTPEERAAYHERYFTVDRAGVQAAGLANRTDAQQAGAMDRQQARLQSQSDLLDTKNKFLDEQNQRKSDDQNRWNAARVAIASNTQGSLNNRALLRQFDSNQSQHGKLLDQAYKESQKQLEAGALLDPKGGVNDGEEFTDPWSGKKMTMNVAQRLRVGNALRSSQQQVGDWQNRASQIEQRFGLQPGAGSAAPAGAAPSGGKTGGVPQAGGRIRVQLQDGRKGSVDANDFDPKTMTPIANEPAPAAGAVAPAAKVATKAQVQDYATKKGISVNDALKEFKASKYTVQ